MAFKSMKEKSGKIFFDVALGKAVASRRVAVKEGIQNVVPPLSPESMQSFINFKRLLEVNATLRSPGRNMFIPERSVRFVLPSQWYLIGSRRTKC